jgi:hypothetical protein
MNESGMGFVGVVNIVKLPREAAMPSCNPSSLMVHNSTAVSEALPWSKPTGPNRDTMINARER